MSNEFEPYLKKKGNNQGFSVWEYESIIDKEAQVEINEEERFLAECERLKNEAIDKGYAEGMQRAQAEITEKRQQFVRWFDILKNPVKLLDEQVTQEIIQTIIWLSQHCIGVELSVHPDKLKNLFDSIKSELPSLKAYKVLAMHPEDVNWVQSEFNEKGIDGLQEILVADPSLSRGDFYLKGEYSELDGRIYTRLTTLFAKHITQDNLITPMKDQD
ncbi:MULTISPECIES: flagellar assembly protein FliH [Legionella]|uniref:Flagellar assembly protein FliH n=1 Tax=Legionella steelei TaxID=947033 RepID=A0A0W0ZE66_9GAMM|nr:MULTISPECIES: flagellar assembly protein FliH [Legionella]KTD67442.1 polar flagellar assembly protein FliH [Legionella steelei]MBN9227541.1 flagellar assembly protein FliH [Legionella steelei]OJW16045.1 MAG: flagellar assembly protein FliH [Legionella sp. 39-23]